MFETLALKKFTPLANPRGAQAKYLEADSAIDSAREKDVVSAIHATKLREPKTDPQLQAAGERVRAAEELERLGIADKSGKRVGTDLLRDMFIVAGPPGAGKSKARDGLESRQKFVAVF